MNNGWNAQYYQQQTRSNDKLQSFSMPSLAPVTRERSHSSQICPTNSANISSTMKRGRVCSEESSVSLHSLTRETSIQPGDDMGKVPNSITPKKARSNNYQVPRSVKPSLLTALGTLAGGSSETASVPTRRRLSGGHLDKFIGDHDKSFETDPNRPRSMSF